MGSVKLGDCVQMLGFNFWMMPRIFNDEVNVSN